jgi:enoyl-CoA hydratase/carnithine racemase
MLNPDKQTVTGLKALPKTTIAAVHGVSSSGGLGRGVASVASD